MANLILNDRQLCDLEMLLNGAFSPLDGFLGERDYHSVLETSRLTSGDLWPIPIVLAATKKDIAKFGEYGSVVTLRNEENLPIASLTLQEVYEPDFDKECISVFCCVDSSHPYQKEVIDHYRNSGGSVMYISGPVKLIQMPPHFDFVEHRMTPAQTKERFAQLGWKTIVAFQTRNPMHRSHFELTLNALKTVNESLGIESTATSADSAKLLLHPVVGETQDCDVSYPVRVRCYKKMLKNYPKSGSESLVLLGLIPLSMRMAGPKEALWHALIRQNYGCTHFIIGRDHAGPSSKKQDGTPFYDPYGSHKLLDTYKSELKIKIVPSQMIVYVQDLQLIADTITTGIANANLPIPGRYLPMDQIDPKRHIISNISGTEQRKLLTDGKSIPEWFTFPEISDELKSVYKPMISRGFCVYFVGLSGSGKTTLAKALQAKLEETTHTRAITMLDGDVVRQNLSRELGFSKEHRSINIRRIGYVASEIVKHGGICLCANIAPYASDRDYNKKQINGQNGSGYIEVYMDTPIDICESRDIKGLYKLARTGVIPVFTGVSDAFEIPTKPDVVCSVSNTIAENLKIVFDKLQELQFV